jgi:hypothetical protein
MQTGSKPQAGWKARPNCRMPCGLTAPDRRVKERVLQPILANAGNAAVNGFVNILALGIFVLIIVAAVWFFRGPAQAADRYVNSLGSQFQNPADEMLFRQIYQTKGPRSTTVAWLLTTFLSPTISYLYQAKWALAVISFLTLQGLFLWWLASIFFMPAQVLATNKKLADEAFQQVLLSRGPGALGARGASAPMQPPAAAAETRPVPPAPTLELGGETT